MGLIPVYLGMAYLPIGQAYQGNAFQFTPASTSILPVQARNVAYGRPNRDGFNVDDVANDFKVHPLRRFLLRVPPPPERD